MEPVAIAAQVYNIWGSVPDTTSAVLVSITVLSAIGGIVGAIFSDRKAKSEAKDLEIKLSRIRTSEWRSLGESLVNLGVDAADTMSFGTSSGKLNGSASKESSVPERQSESNAAPSQSTDLSLAALWPVTQERIDTYHGIVTKQAKSSFIATQITAGAGFVIVVGLGILSASAHSLFTSVTAASVAVIGGALSTYVASTFMKSQAQATAQLRRFFAQPMENTRLLGVERLIETLPSNERSAAIMKVIDKMTFTIDDTTVIGSDKQG